MRKVNIVFDYVFDDADIIEVPDEIFSDIEKIGQEFLDWLPGADDPAYWTIINGKKCTVAETDGFIKWINDSYCKNFEKACVISRNTNYDPSLKIIEF